MESSRYRRLRRFPLLAFIITLGLLAAVAADAQRLQYAVPPAASVSAPLQPSSATSLLDWRIGAGALLVTWGATALGSLAMGDEFAEITMIPVVGPWATRSLIESGKGEYLAGAEPLLLISGVAQGASFLYLTAALISGVATRGIRAGISPDGATTMEIRLPLDF